MRHHEIVKYQMDSERLNAKISGLEMIKEKLTN